MLLVSILQIPELAPGDDFSKGSALHKLKSGFSYTCSLRDVIDLGILDFLQMLNI